MLGRMHAVGRLQVSGSVQRSKRALEEIYETGTHILTNMAGNRERLKVRGLCCWSQGHSTPLYLGRRHRGGSLSALTNIASVGNSG